MLHEYTNDRGETLRIDYDRDPMDPREWDNLGKFLVPPRCEYVPAEAENILNWEDAEDDEKTLDAAGYLYLPVYVYDHSGVAYNTTGFSCPWDSGQIGYYVVSKSDLRKEYGCKRITAKIRKIALRTMRAEVETYGAYRNGEVYQFTIEDASGDVIDACGGYYRVEDILDDYPEFKAA